MKASIACFFLLVRGHIIFCTGSTLACLGHAAQEAGSTGPPPSRTIPIDGVPTATLCFEGYLTSKDDTMFVLSLRNKEGRVSASAWVKVGQMFANHVLLDYDPQHEIISIKSPGGHDYSLPLVASKTVDAKDEAQRNAFARAMVFVDDTRRSIRKQFDLPVEFTVDLDGSMMPVSVRERFRAQREEAEKQGGYVVGVYVEGEWVFSTYRGQHARLIPASLTDENRRKVEGEYVLIYAEAMARATAQKKRQKDVASK